MDSTAHKSYNATDRSYLAILKKEIHGTAAEAGFSKKKLNEIDIVVAEMASNLIKHAGGGEILVRVLQDEDTECLELISIDNGPGMSDPVRMMEDGMSTANTLGHGLGSMKRLSDLFEIYSQKDWGTIALARIYKKERPARQAKPVAEVRAVVVPKPGEEVSGDGACWLLTRSQLRVFLGDGLGHGPEAHVAVQKAISMLKVTPGDDPVELLRSMHVEVKKTRGLVGTLLIYDIKQKRWGLCGIGNITTRTQNGLMTKNHMPYNGVIGMNIPGTMKEQQLESQRGQLVIMCSDGIRSRWELQKYNGIFKYDLSILAAAIYKDYGRRTDDMSIVITRINSGL